MTGKSTYIKRDDSLENQPSMCTKYKNFSTKSLLLFPVFPCDTAIF